MGSTVSKIWEDVSEYVAYDTGKKDSEQLGGQEANLIVNETSPQQLHARVEILKEDPRSPAQSFDRTPIALENKKKLMAYFQDNSPSFFNTPNVKSTSSNGDGNHLMVNSKQIFNNIDN